ncbi:MAG: hypothetical protein PSN36_03200 [Gammaproteobacteria bacterium]|nr:hypothetical protein [Gammaproteobacteria bacterium]
MVRYLENIGTIDTPIFSRQQGVDNFFKSVSDNTNVDQALPTFADINNDGILDFISEAGRGRVDYYEATSNIIKVKTVHHQDMDGISTHTASDKLTETFAWNTLTADNRYAHVRDTSITNFDLFNDSLDVSSLLKHLDEDSKLSAISVQNSGSDSILSIGSFNLTLANISNIDTTQLIHDGIIII